MAPETKNRSREKVLPSGKRNEKHYFMYKLAHEG